ncbi:MAG: hypothetical protein J0H43_16380 [Actinobacteria bacterium]|nr:hypothetical protein [Actinomycetota bacterium]
MIRFVYRVVQWATGAMGTAVLRSLIDHPATEVVGVYVYDAGKAGVDAGALARRPETGVRATADVAEILRLDADVVVHAGRIGGPYGSHKADIAALLRSGKNVISINGYSHPAYWAGPRLTMLEDAGRAGGATLVGAGLNPGFVAEQMAVTATGITARVEHLEIVETADGREVRNPDYLFGILGFGADPAGIDPNDPGWGPVAALNGMYEELLAAVAYRLGIALERVESDHVLHAATEDLHLPAGIVRQGTVSHTNWRWHAYAGGERRLTMSIHWFVETSHLGQDDPPLWSVHLTGHPGLRMTIELEKHPDDRSRMGAEQYAVAAEVINTIPHVVAAPPGVLLRPIATPARDDIASDGA